MLHLPTPLRSRRFGKAYAAFGGTAAATPKIDHFCALVNNYKAQEMRKAVEAAGVTMGAGPVGMPGGLAKTIIPANRVTQDDAAVQAIGLDHVMLQVSGMETSRTKNPGRIWFTVARTRLGLERDRDHECMRATPAVRSIRKAACATVSAAMDKYALINRYHVEMLAYFPGKLQATDGDGTLLDHSMILYGSSTSNGNQHDHDPLPLILAGGASGSLNGGRHMKYAPHTPRVESAAEHAGQARRRAGAARRQHR